MTMQKRYADYWPNLRWHGALAALSCLLSSGLAQAQMSPEMCGPLTNAYGPYDYRTDKRQLPIVEGAHFTPEVELLIKGNAGYLGGDLDYTLRAFPNHHRALVSMMRYGEREKALRVPQARYDVECYFVRAVTFKPHDSTARMLFATFLKSKGRQVEALGQLAAAELYVKDNPFSNFNLGLLYFELKDYPNALKFAHKAQALDFPRTDLKDKLIAAGQWSEPPPDVAAEPASAASGPDL